MLNTATKAQEIKRPIRTTLKFQQLTVTLHPDRTDDFIEEIELLCRKYAGLNYSFRYDEQE